MLRGVSYEKIMVQKCCSNAGELEQRLFVNLPRTSNPPFGTDFIPSLEFPSAFSFSEVQKSFRGVLFWSATDARQLPHTCAVIQSAPRPASFLCSHCPYPILILCTMASRLETILSRSLSLEVGAQKLQDARSLLVY